MTNHSTSLVTDRGAHLSLVSCVFLALTLVVYCRVPELNSLHGKIVISNVLSIFSVTAYLVTVYHGSHLLPPRLCRVSGPGMKQINSA